MRSWRSSGLALWAIVAVSLAGCSSTSIPARAVRVATGQVQPVNSVSADRLIAIGRTFERQGNFARAQGLYNLVLSQHPGDSEAAQGLQRIADLQSGHNQIFDGAAPSPAAAPANTMMAAAQQTPHTRTASATQPVASPVRTVAAQAPAVTQAQVTAPAEPVAANLADTGNWQLPRGAEVAAPEVESESVSGRASFDSTGVETDPIETAVDEPAAAVEADNAAGISRATLIDPEPIDIEACLDNPADHIELLSYCLSDADPDTRSLAAFLLGESGQHETLNLLRDRLTTEPSPQIRATVAEAIGKLDCSDAGARECLLSGLRSDSVPLRSQSAFALRVFAAAPELETLAALEHALSDAHAEVTAMAALSLSDYGSSARAALPALQAARTGASMQVQDALDAAIARIANQ